MPLFYPFPKSVAQLLLPQVKCMLNVFLLGVLLRPVLLAQPVLVKDIHASFNSSAVADPGLLVSANGVLYYAATHRFTGRELYKSDGTPVGTVLVKDLAPGVAGADPGNLTAGNGVVYFTATDGKSGRELYKSNGTPGGTLRVKDVTLGANGTTFGSFLHANGVLYFTADDGVHGLELWKSDGTEAGTLLVKDITPGTGGSSPTNLRQVNGVLFFTANNHLYKSNGTAAGTVPVKDADAANLTAVGNVLYFTDANTVLYKSDGTTAGTVPVKEVTGAETKIVMLTPYQNLLYFFVENREEFRFELWKSNGTPAGTVLVTSQEGPGPYEVKSIGGSLYWLSQAISSYDGYRLWKSDGTSAGTAVLQEEVCGCYSPLAPRTGYGATHLTNVGGAPYFVRRFDKLSGWGDLVSTSYSIESPAGSVWEGSAVAENLTVVNGALYFTSGGLLYRGNEPVKSSQAGTASASPRQLTPLNNRLYFAANRGLWQSDGTAAGTTAVKNGINAVNLAGANGTLYFSGDDGTQDVIPEYSPYLDPIGHGQELWKSNGTQAGTVRVKEVNPDYQVRCVDEYTGEEVYCEHPNARTVFEPSGSNPTHLTDVNGTLFFTAVHDASGAQSLWKSDGTEAGTVKLKDIAARLLVRVNGMLFYAGGEGASLGLYVSNGTPQGTVLLKAGIDPTWLTPVNNTLYFAAGGSLWKSNGTATGTSVVKSGIAPADLTRVSSTLFFTASESAAGRELYKSDGTAAGTVRVRDIVSGTGSASPASLTPVNGLLYFTASNGTSRGLYRSDGTSAGTVLVKGSITATGLTNVNGIVCFFTAGGLWRSDGTGPGTQRVKDGVPATHTAVLNGVLYFAYDDGYSGEELWKYDPLQCATPTASLALEGSTVCSNGSATVRVKAAQAGVYYQLYSSNVPVGQSLKSSGGDLLLPVPATHLSVGTQAFTVKAFGCTEVTLTQQATITVLPALNPPAVPGKTTASGQTATLTASGAPAGAAYRWYSAASGGNLLFTGASYTTPALTVTTHYYVAAALAGCAESARTKVTVTVSPAGGTTAFRVNAGGNAFATIDARSFAADAYFAGGVVSTATTQGIAGTADDYLYQTGRHGASFAYNFPTGNGSYDVVLHFAETYYGNTVPGGIGSRKFHVNLEGVRKLTDYDIVARAGGALRVAQETFRVNVADGTLTVAFMKGASDNPAVKAIEVLPAGNALTLNAGGGAWVTAAGKRFYPDSYYASGSVSGISSGDILNTTDDALYRDARVGVCSYGLPSGNGTFDVVLHFAETYWGSRAAGGVGSRKFNLYVENVKRLSEYDIFASAGGAMRAKQETIRVTVIDGVLNLYFAKGTADNPAVSAIEVIPVALAARVAAPSTDAGDGNVKLYPNPVVGTLTVGLPFPAGEVDATTITDAAGNAKLLNAHWVSAESEVQIEVGRLPAGLYLLKIEAHNGHRVLKFVRQ